MEEKGGVGGLLKNISVGALKAEAQNFSSPNKIYYNG